MNGLYSVSSVDGVTGYAWGPRVFRANLPNKRGRRPEWDGCSHTRKSCACSSMYWIVPRRHDWRTCLYRIGRIIFIVPQTSAEDFATDEIADQAF